MAKFIKRVIFEEERDLSFEDEGLRKYIYLPAPYSLGFESGKETRGKRISSCQNILDMFCCSLMRSSAKTGKKNKVFKIIIEVFDMIRVKGLNPYQILISAIEKLSLHETTYKVKIAGSNVLKSSEASPVRKLDRAIKQLGLDIHKSSMRTSKKIKDLIYSKIMEISQYQKGPLPPLLKKIEEDKQVAKSAR